MLTLPWSHSFFAGSDFCVFYIIRWRFFFGTLQWIFWLVDLLLAAFACVKFLILFILSLSAVHIQIRTIQPSHFSTSRCTFFSLFVLFLISIFLHVLRFAVDSTSCVVIASLACYVVFNFFPFFFVYSSCSCYFSLRFDLLCSMCLYSLFFGILCCLCNTLFIYLLYVFLVCFAAMLFFLSRSVRSSSHSSSRTPFAFIFNCIIWFRSIHMWAVRLCRRFGYTFHLVGLSFWLKCWINKSESLQWFHMTNNVHCKAIKCHNTSCIFQWLECNVFPTTYAAI